MADTLVKFCGCTSPHDVTLAAEAGADAFGMIFAPSPRRIAWEAASEIAEQRLEGIAPVAVFVNPRHEEVERVRSLFPHAWLQFSGDEPPQFIARYGDRAIKAIHVGGSSSPEECATQYPGALLVLDTHDDRVAGGTGRSFAWPSVTALAHERRIIVAGGLTPENVGRCVGEVRPFGVDVRSGIETDGRKDPKKMSAFVRAVHAA